MFLARNCRSLLPFSKLTNEQTRAGSGTMCGVIHKVCQRLGNEEGIGISISHIELISFVIRCKFKVKQIGLICSQNMNYYHWAEMAKPYLRQENNCKAIKNFQDKNFISLLATCLRNH